MKLWASDKLGNVGTGGGSQMGMEHGMQPMHLDLDRSGTRMPAGTKRPVRHMLETAEDHERFLRDAGMVDKIARQDTKSMCEDVITRCVALLVRDHKPCWEQRGMAIKAER
jgi:hypothetical protein